MVKSSFLFHKHRDHLRSRFLTAMDHPSSSRGLQAFLRLQHTVGRHHVHHEGAGDTREVEVETGLGARKAR